jgi:hypothetical protein
MNDNNTLAPWRRRAKEGTFRRRDNGVEGRNIDAVAGARYNPIITGD